VRVLRLPTEDAETASSRVRDGEVFVSDIVDGAGVPDVPDGAPAFVEQGYAMRRVSGEQVQIGGAGVVVAEDTLTV
jgi:hypothetical protein